MILSNGDTFALGERCFYPRATKACGDILLTQARVRKSRHACMPAAARYRYLRRAWCSLSSVVLSPTLSVKSLSFLVGHASNLASIFAKRTHLKKQTTGTVIASKDHIDGRNHTNIGVQVLDQETIYESTKGTMVKTCQDLGKPTNALGTMIPGISQGSRASKIRSWRISALTLASTQRASLLLLEHWNQSRATYAYRRSCLSVLV